MLLIPLALRGVKYRALGAAAILRRNLLIYGLGGIVAPFIGIKLDRHRHHRTGSEVMRRQLLTGFFMTIALIVLLGVIYPLAVSASARSRSTTRPNGSFVKNSDGQVVGSSLIGQRLRRRPRQSRPEVLPATPVGGRRRLRPHSPAARRTSARRTRSSSHRYGPQLLPRRQDRCRRQPVLGPDGQPVQECYGDTVPGRIAPTATSTTLAPTPRSRRRGHRLGLRPRSAHLVANAEAPGRTRRRRARAAGRRRSTRSSPAHGRSRMGLPR